MPSAEPPGCRSRAQAVGSARSISAAAAARRSRSPVTLARPTRSAISRHATRMSPRWRLCSTTRPTPIGGCEFKRLRRATVLANIDGNRTQLPCIHRSPGANPPLSSPLSADSSECGITASWLRRCRRCSGQRPDGLEFLSADARAVLPYLCFGLPKAASSSSNAFASFRSSVSNPSVNQP
jgi:hypothetical protein